MIDRFHHRGWHYFLLFAICGLMFFLNLGGASLWDVDEGRNSECSYELLESGNWIVPTFNSNLRVDKPALLYWLQIFSYLCFGVNEFAARFPSAVAALGTVLLAYELARSMFTRTTGLLAAVIVSTTPMLCGAARFANPDSLLNFCTVLTLTIFWLGLDQRRWWWFALLGAASGLAVLAKGPVGLILPGAVVTLFIVWERQWNIAFDRRWCLAFWTFVLTGLPWYIWVGIETKGEFLVGFLWRHNIERGATAMENHHGFPGYYFVILLVGTTPWSIFLIAAAWFSVWSAIRTPWQHWQNVWSRTAEIADTETERRSNDTTAAYRLLVAWIAAFLLFFSVAATKLPNYVLPAIVPCTLLIARFLQRWRTESIQLPGWFMHACIVSLALLGGGVAIGLTIAGGVGELAMLRGRYFPGLQYWAFIGLVPTASAVACWWFARHRQPGRFITAFALCAVLLLGPMAAFASALFNGSKAPRPLVELTDTMRRDEDIRIGGFQVEYLPSLNFYVKRNVHHLHDDTTLASFLHSRLPAYVFMPAQEWRDREATLGQSARVIARHHDMYHHTEIVVVTNR